MRPKFLKMFVFQVSLQFITIRYQVGGNTYKAFVSGYTANRVA